jgi:hypothetical protein
MDSFGTRRLHLGVQRLDTLLSICFVIGRFFGVRIWCIPMPVDILCAAMRNGGSLLHLAIRCRAGKSCAAMALEMENCRHMAPMDN